MQILKAFPPNYSQIIQYLSPPKDAVFAYGGTLYNPSDGKIPPDIMVHEEVHEKQMKDWLPDSWWQQYLMDSAFRKQMEVEAFSAQYNFVKNQVPNRVAKLCLSDLADNLSSNYKLDLSYNKAYTLLRLSVKNMLK